MVDQVKYMPEAERLNRDFPRWEAWVGLVNGCWHARLRGAVPPVMVHGDGAQDIREQIEQHELRQTGGNSS